MLGRTGIEVKAILGVNAVYVPTVTVLAFHVTWSRALARPAQAVWSGRTRYLYTN